MSSGFVSTTQPLLTISIDTSGRQRQTSGGRFGGRLTHRSDTTPGGTIPNGHVCSMARLGPPRGGEALLELAIFAASTVEPGVCRETIPRRLTSDAGPNAGQRPAARLWDRVAAFKANGIGITRGNAGARSQDAIHNGVVDLILHRPVRRPPACHVRPLLSLVSGRDIGMSPGGSKAQTRCAGPGAPALCLLQKR